MIFKSGLLSGVFSKKKVILLVVMVFVALLAASSTAMAATYRTSNDTHPSSVYSYGNIDVGWRVDPYLSFNTIIHSEIHWGTSKTNKYNNVAPISGSGLGSYTARFTAPKASSGIVYVYYQTHVTGFSSWPVVGTMEDYGPIRVITVVPPEVKNISSPSSVDSGQPIQISWLIEGGNQISTDVHWGLSADSWNTNISPRQYGTTWKNFSYTLAGQTGPKTIYYKVQYTVDGVYYWSTLKSVNVNSRPDLRVVSLTPSKINPRPNEQIQVTAAVKNFGGSPAGASNVHLYADPPATPSAGDGNQIASKNTGAINAGQTRVETFSVKWPNTGTYNLWAVADGTNAINESEENNNVFGPTQVKVFDSILTVLNSWDSGPGNWSFEASKVTRGDYDGDGNDDIAFMYGYRTERDVKVLVAKGKSDGTFAAPAPWWQAGAGNWDWNGSKLVSGDFNGDGKDDLSILYGYKTQRDVKAFVLRSTGTSFNSPASWWQAGPGNWDWKGSKLDVGDFDGDGKDDLVILYGYKTQRDVRVFVLKSNGASFNGPSFWWHAGAGNWDWNGSKLSVGDYDGNGKDDLSVLYGYKTQRDVKAFVLKSTGTSFNSPASWWHAGAGNWDWKGSKLLSGDYNGDGDEDIAIFYGYGSTKAAVFVFLSNGSSKFASQGAWYTSANGAWNWNNTKILSGDFDGNGIDNLAGVYKRGKSHIRLFMIK